MKAIFGKLIENPLNKVNLKIVTTRNKHGDKAEIFLTNTESLIYKT